MPNKRRTFDELLMNYKIKQAQRAVDDQIIFIDIVRAPVRKRQPKPEKAKKEKPYRPQKKPRPAKPESVFKRVVKNPKVMTYGRPFIADTPKQKPPRPPAIYSNRSWDEMIYDILSK